MWKEEEEEREREDGGYVSERGFGEDSQVLKEERVYAADNWSGELRISRWLLQVAGGSLFGGLYQKLLASCKV